MSSFEKTKINSNHYQVQSGNNLNISENQSNFTSTIDNSTIKKKSIAIKMSILFGAVIILLAVVLIIYFIVVKRKKNNKSKIEFSYGEAEKLIGSEKTNKNRNLFIQSSNSLSGFKDLLNNISFTVINIKVNDSYKNINLSSLLNTNDESNQVIKEDLDLYSSRYDTLSKEINFFSKDLTKSYKNLSIKINDYQKEADNITIQFEQTIKKLAIPLLSYINEENKNNKSRILESGDFMTKFREEIDKVNNYFNKIGNGLKGTIDSLIGLVNDTSKKVENFITDTTNGINTFVSNTFDFLSEKSHEILKDIKDKFEPLKNKIEELKLSLGEKKDKLTYYLKEINNDENTKEYEDIISNLNNLMEE